MDLPNSDRQSETITDSASIRAASDHILSTTRSVRKRLDFEREVPLSLVRESLDIALQAPTGSNRQGWSWVIVTDPDKKDAIADLYRQAFNWYATEGPGATTEFPDGDVRANSAAAVADSATYLANNLQKCPVFVIPCIEGRVENVPMVLAQASVYGSILPAVWSFMLALRSRGLGSAYTTLHLVYENQVAELLGIPQDVTQTALLPVAFFTGSTFARAKRLTVEEVTHLNSWGSKFSHP